MRVSPALLMMQRSGGKERARQASVPAPIGGLNTRDGLDTMPITDAQELTNLFPGTEGVSSRNGYTEHGTGMGNNVETIADLNISSARKMVCAASSKLYTVPDSGGAATEIGSGFSNARWQHVNFAGKLALVNGADAPQQYDGTTLSSVSLSGTGLTSTNLAGINIYKGRSFWWENAASHFWYNTSAGALGGTLAKFELGQIASQGGYLVAMGTWTRDGGSGPDDYAVFFMSSGEVLVYVGTDPGSASDWSLVGRYDIGAPLAVRGVTKYGGDLYVMTKSDFVPLSAMLSNGGVSSGLSKLSGGAADAARLYGANYGWQAVLYSRGNRVLFNIPQKTNATYIQYGFNTITGAAFKFTGMNARCFGVYKDRLYFGGSGSVYLADEGAKDDGANIHIIARTSFSNLGNQYNKRVSAFTPVIRADGSVRMAAALAYDYGITSVGQLVASDSVGTPWGSPWGAPWSPEERLRTDRFSAYGRGKSVSLRMEARLLGQQFTWYRTDYLYKLAERF